MPSDNYEWQHTSFSYYHLLMNTIWDVQGEERSAIRSGFVVYLHQKLVIYVWVV